jgi:hypothetical protein
LYHSKLCTHRISQAPRNGFLLQNILVPLLPDAGCNVYLRCHTNDDFTMSMVHILLKGGIVTILMMMLLHISVSHHWEWLFQ